MGTSEHYSYPKHKETGAAKADASGSKPVSVSDTARAKSGHRWLKRTGQAALVIVGARIGIALIRRAGRLLFKPKASQPSEQAQPVSGAAAPPVPPATHWKPLDVPAPAIPTDFKPLLSLTLPCSVYTFYTNVISQQSDFLQQQHEQIDHIYNYVKRAWWPTPLNLNDYPDANDQNMLQGMGRTVFDLVLGAGSSGGFTRTVTFVAPPKPPNTADAKCVRREQFAVYQGNVLVMATAMNMLNIPFKECFMVLTAWRVEPAADPGQCNLTVLGKVHFVKGTIMGSIIRATTFRDMGGFYKALGPKIQALIASAPAAVEPSPGHTSSGWRFTRAPATPSKPPKAPGAGPSHLAASVGSDGTLLAQTMSPSRQLRIMFVFLVLVGSVVHQCYMHNEILQLQARLGQ